MIASIHSPNNIHNNLGIEFALDNTEEYNSVKKTFRDIAFLAQTNSKQYEKKFGKLLAFLQSDSSPTETSNGYIFIEFWGSCIEDMIAYCEYFQEQLHIVINGL